MLESYHVLTVPGICPHSGRSKRIDLLPSNSRWDNINLSEMVVVTIQGVWDIIGTNRHAASGAQPHNSGASSSTIKPRSSLQEALCECPLLFDPGDHRPGEGLFENPTGEFPILIRPSATLSPREKDYRRKKTFRPKPFHQGSKAVNRQAILDRLNAEAPALRLKYDIKSLAVFGSMARGDDHEGSDVDVLVAFEGEPTFRNFMGLKLDLEELFGRPVDLGTSDTLRPEIRSNVEKDLIHVP